MAEELRRAGGRFRWRLIAPRAPSGLKTFLAASAIIDDMGAVVVIALFYTRSIAWGALAMAGLMLLLLIALNMLRVRRLTVRCEAEQNSRLPGS